jgi:serine/threonine-protein kinase
MAWLYQGEARGLRARWRARRGQGRAEDFEEAAHAFEKALTLRPEREDYRVAFGHFCREWALWRRAASLAPAPALERGRALADEVLAHRPAWADALLLRASLGRALEPEPLDTGREDLERALALNPQLAPWWERHFPKPHLASP